MSEFDRVRWHCRRGLLELDIVLNRFVDSHFERLDGGQRSALYRLLALPDNELWDLVAGRREPSDPDSAEILRYLR